ncbi:uncharacterized protein JCM6883_006099 [Sporobolomyces salmoneus]|uniref:uncharacterized protein n=1 Tax=Sporobolomyces salmoneus TaxID=183962 RepID=UPI0031773717
MALTPFFLSQPGRLSWNRYQAKSALLLCLYLLSPSPSSVSTAPHQSIDTPSISSQESSTRNLEPGSTIKGTQSGASVEVPWTAKYEEGDRMTTQDVEMEVKGSTSKGGNYEWTNTPALSDPPPKETNRALRSLGKRAEEQKEEEEPSEPVTRDRASFDDEQLSTTETSFTALPLSPFSYTLLLLHALFFAQYLCDSFRTRIAQSLLSNPLPPPFKDPSSAQAASHLSFSKRLNRFRWRLKLLWKRCGSTLIKLSLLGLIILTLLGSGAYDAVRRNEKPGWNRVFEFGVDLPFVEVKEYRTDSRVQAANWFRPSRDLVLLELLSTCCIFLHALRPVLLSLSFLPTNLHAPRSCLPRNAPDLLVPTSHLLPHLISFAYSFFAILEWLVLILSRNLDNGEDTSRYRLLSVTTLVFIYSICGELGNLLVRREKLEEEFEKIGYLNREFSKEKIGIERAGGEGWEEKIRLLLEELEGESCCICFEEDWHEGNGFRSRCFLTNCGHQVHAACLYAWFKRQSFCPACHTKVSGLAQFPPLPPSVEARLPVAHH